MKTQLLICELLGAESTSIKLMPDGGVDGVIPGKALVQVKDSEDIQEGIVREFAVAMKNWGFSQGLFVAKSFDNSAYKEAMRMKHFDGLDMVLLTFDQVVKPEISKYFLHAKERSHR